ncbi:MAG: YdeI/OmpD-associated family protein [Bacillota bacterium]|nr:YdeI/OmpD-associated family protein [Bacillota bacterium]
MRTTFSAVIKPSKKCFACVEVPPQAAEILGCNDEKVKIHGTIDSSPFTADVIPESNGTYSIYLTSVLCRIIKAGVGTNVGFSIERADDERTARIPSDFKKALAASPDSKAMFDMYSYSNKKDILEWITSAAAESVRQSRMERVIVKLGQEYLEYLDTLPSPEE